MWKYASAKNDCDGTEIRRRTIPVWRKFEILLLKIRKVSMTLEK